jgi:hypothetical protein
MAPENQSLAMLENYNAKYILVFVTLGIATSSDQSYYVAQFAGFGDEGKWSWMARISGQARDRFIQEGYMNANMSWTDETAFGQVSNSSSTWEWNDMGKNSTIYELMSYAKQRWVDVSGSAYNVVSDQSDVQTPTYFKEAYFSGEDFNPLEAQSTTGGLIPVVALYEIDWDAYYNATG